MKKQHIAIIFFIFVTCTILPGLSGCGKPYARITFQAYKNLNPDDSGAALPVVVWIYQLKNKERFESADFISIWQDEGEALGDDLLAKRETTVYPNSDNQVEVQREPDARFLGLVALFRQPSGNSWRRIIPITSKRQKVYLVMDEQEMEITDGKRKRQP